MFKRLVKRTMSKPYINANSFTYCIFDEINFMWYYHGIYCQTKFQGILHIFNVQKLASAIKDLMSNIFILALSNLY